MRNLRRLRFAIVACVCLPFTGNHVGWAEPARSDLYVEDPYAPHHTDGTTARLGTAVGYLFLPPSTIATSSGIPASGDVLALGFTGALGHRWGRVAIEAEYSYLGFRTLDSTETHVGNGHRLGVLARYDVIQLGPHVVGPNSMLALYVEGGAATAWNYWSRPAYNEPSRIVPDDTKRVEGQAGVGIMLDHRLQEPIGFPRRVGWFLGWRVSMSPHQPIAASVCRGVSCRSVTMMDDNSIVDRSMLFQSSLEFTF
ncbi:MAG: hypothetical protein JWO36_846 [Myxococcales bacterium]|nr:hypothetical protein [Myxococcales bacterium]